MNTSFETVMEAMMSKLKFLKAASTATVFAAVVGLSTLPSFAADTAPPAKADAAPAAAPADPDAAAADAAPATDDATTAPAEAAATKPAEAKPVDAKPAEPAAKPMMAPVAPAAAPQKSAAAPAAAPVNGALTIGATVVGADGKEVGKVNRVSSGPNGEITEIHVNTSGAAGLTGSIVAIPGGKIASGGDKVKLSMTSDEVSKLPKVGGKG